MKFVLPNVTLPKRSLLLVRPRAGDTSQKIKAGFTFEVYFALRASTAA